MERNWKIVYTRYSGMEKKAVEFLSRELGAMMNRDPGVYTLHVLPCETRWSEQDQNVVRIGLYGENPDIAALIRPEQLPADGYALRVTDNPKNPSYKAVVITANDPQNLFYGAVDFIDDYLPSTAPMAGGLHTPCEIFDHPLPDFFTSSRPDFSTRAVMSWGHVVCDYRRYIEDLARLKINQLILWNEYLPINADDVRNYAHEFGIQLIWGFSWGWYTDFSGLDLNRLEDLKDEITETYKNVYQGKGDGIYFQSFTEMDRDTLGGVLIAEAVSAFVNDVADRILRITPGLKIQFGLHAMSVREHLSYIQKVDPRVEIVWEDCGAFPYSYSSAAPTEEEIQTAVDFTRRILTLRESGASGLLYKGQMTMDWTKFAHQPGPYIMGMESDAVIKNDRSIHAPIWRYFQSDWFQNGQIAYDFTRRVYEIGGGRTGVGIAGTLTNGIWFPEALTAQILWNCHEPYRSILDKVSKRFCLTMA